MFRKALAILAQNRGTMNLQQAVRQSDLIIVDVRTPQEVVASPMTPGAVNIPMDALEKRLAELGTDKTRPVIFYCAKGIRAANAAAFLRQRGFTNALSTTDANSMATLLKESKSK